MKIQLNKGQFAIVDKEDFEYLSQWKWYVSRNKHFPFTEYAKRNRHVNDKSKEIFMHRVILEKHTKTIKHQLVDHINHDGLDNRNLNLRIANNSQNKAHGKKYSSNTSGYKGVSWDKEQNKWGVAISIQGKDKRLGRFIDKEEAALAYNKAAKQYFGEFAYLNQVGGSI